MIDPIRIRASSFGELLDCPRRWYATHILGMRRPTSGSARLGTAIHKATAYFDSARTMNAQPNTAEAVDVFMTTLHSKDEEVRWYDDMRVRDAETVGALLTNEYCTKHSPRFDYVAVEIELKPLIVDCGGVSIELTGSMDRGRIAVAQPGMGVVDLKSGKRAVDSGGRAATQGHKIQCAVYELLSENTGYSITEPSTIIGMRTSKDPAIAAAPIHDARKVLIGTQDEPGALDYAAHLLKTGIFPGNARSQLCSEKWCVAWEGCPWRD